MVSLVPSGYLWLPVVIHGSPSSQWLPILRRFHGSKWLPIVPLVANGSLFYDGSMVPSCYPWFPWFKRFLILRWFHGSQWLSMVPLVPSGFLFYDGSMVPSGYPWFPWFQMVPYFTMVPWFPVIIHGSPGSLWLPILRWFHGSQC